MEGGKVKLSIRDLESSQPRSRYHSPPMKRILLALFATASLSFAVDPPDTTGWQDLFAADLSNTVEPGKWELKDGILVAKDHDTLWTKDSYGDFILDLDFKVEKESNSGVFIRSGNIKDVLSALEIQVHDSADGSKYGMVAAIYDAMPPSKSMAKPVGEWNHFTITCKGPLVSVVFNGEEVINANLDNWPEAGKNPDGTPNKFKKALKDYARTGPIGLQGLHGKAQAPVYYRNLKIKVLE
ncbi:MAG: hypothetical protein B7Z37_19010 [Verrucomicrobia bacterium 12-59-8]|nr:MAG: hypothetical protein B7Z37_19010 [Verrucomicrobia bacterium 12-59-8]